MGKTTVEGLYAVEREELLDLLGLREGMVIDEEKVRTGIKRAFLKGAFDTISVETNDLDPADVTIRVKEKDIIRKVYVLGNHELSVRRVRELLILKEDEIMRDDLIAEAARDLKQNYALSGYPDAVVEITAAASGRPHKVDLRVHIDAGQPLLIKEVAVKGSEDAADIDLGISEGDRYDHFRLKDRLQRLRERLKKGRYYHPVVGPYTYQNGILTVTVQPGRQLSIAIDGNSALSTKRLEQETPFFEVEAVQDEIIDEAVNRMLSLYHTEGFPFAQIAPVIKTDDRSVLVSFFVFEGQRIRTRSVRFSGTTLPVQSLKNVMELKEKGHFNPDLTERDRETLREFYLALGYLDAAIKEFEVKTDIGAEAADIFISVDEGIRTTLASIDIQGASPGMKERIIPTLNIKAGDPYNEVDISDARFRILDFYINEGNANIDVLVQRTIEGNKASVLFTVVEGRKTRIGKTIITGNRATRYAVIRREIAHAEGGSYTFNTLAEGRRKLYKLGLFSDVEMEAVNAGEDTRDLLVRVKEGNAGAFEFGFGYADYEEFRGYAEVSYRNLWGMNRQGLVRTELSSIDKRFIAQYTEPWFLGRPLPFRVLFLHEKRTEITVPERTVRYRLDRYSLSAGIEKNLSDRLKADLYYEYSLVRTSDVQPDVVLSREDVGTLSISAIRPSLVYDSRDNPFDPTQGVVAGVSLKVASSVLFSETNFLKLTVYGSTFHKLHKRLVLAMSARGGIALGYQATDELPIVERFFLGGRSTVRGYEQDGLGPKGSDGNPTGGNAFAMGSIELRTNIGRGFSMVPFFDFGNVWIKMNDFTPSDIRYTAGIGLRYTTPVGPLRVDYGFKLNREKDESSGELHFSVGHAF